MDFGHKEDNDANRYSRFVGRGVEGSHPVRKYLLGYTESSNKLAARMRPFGRFRSLLVI